MRAIHTRALASKHVFSVAVAKPQHCIARFDVGREPQGKAFHSNSSNQPKLSRIGYVNFAIETYHTGVGSYVLAKVFQSGLVKREALPGRIST